MSKIPQLDPTASPVTIKQRLLRYCSFLGSTPVGDTDPIADTQLSRHILSKLERVGRIKPASGLTALAGTNQTITAAMIFAGGVVGTPTGAATYTTDTAAAIITALNLGVNEQFAFDISNTSAGANTITLAGGTGVTLDGAPTLAQNTAATFALYMTAAGALCLRKL